MSTKRKVDVVHLRSRQHISLMAFVKLVLVRNSASVLVEKVLVCETEIYSSIPRDNHINLTLMLVDLCVRFILVSICSMGKSC